MTDEEVKPILTAATMPNAVEIVAKAAPEIVESPELVARPKTTAEEDRQAFGLRTEESLNNASRRYVSIMWERTQQIISLVVVVIAMGTAAFVMIRGISGSEQSLASNVAFVFMSSTTSFVIGLYFGRRIAGRQDT